jgi:hypothetical protein
MSRALGGAQEHLVAQSHKVVVVRRRSPMTAEGGSL